VVLRCVDLGFDVIKTVIVTDRNSQELVKVHPQIEQPVVPRRSPILVGLPVGALPGCMCKLPSPKRRARAGRSLYQRLCRLS
jgi:hypothetical protein